MSKIAAIIGQWRHFFERAFIKRESPNFHPITLMMAPIMHTCNRWLKPAESLYFIIIKEPVEPFFPFPKHLIIQSAIHYQSCIGNELETKSSILSIFCVFYCTTNNLNSTFKKLIFGAEILTQILKLNSPNSI